MDEQTIQVPPGPAARAQLVRRLEAVAADMDKLSASMLRLETFVAQSRQQGFFDAIGPALDVTLPGRVKWVREVLDRLKRSCDF